MKKIILLFFFFVLSFGVFAQTDIWISDPSNYKGDCWEMMCDCVEDDEGNGYCCPDGTAFANAGNSHPTYTPCKCPIDKPIWNLEKSKCESITCQEDSECEGKCGVDCEGSCICGENGICSCGGTTCNEDLECEGKCGVDCEGACVCGEEKLCVCSAGCQTNSDCPNGLYCSFTSSLTEVCQKPNSGICLPADDISVGDGTYTSSDTQMDYWSAENFCEAIGKNTVSVWSQCSAQQHTQAVLTGEKCFGWNMDSSDNNIYWTNSKTGSCSSYYTTFNQNVSKGVKQLNSLLRPLCQNCPEVLPGKDELCTQGCGCQKPYACEKDTGRCSCAETSGVIFFLDRSSGNLSSKFKSSLSSLSDLPDVNTAVYFQDYSSKSIKPENEKLINPLKYGRHRPEQIKEWFDYGNIGGGASFKHALNDIKKYCKNNSQILLLFFANNSNQHYRGSLNNELGFWRDFAGYAKNNCQFDIWLVGANEKIADLFASTKFSMTKSVSAYEYIFKDAVESVCHPRKIMSGGVNKDFCEIPINFKNTTKSQCALCPDGTRFWPEPTNYVESRDASKIDDCYMCTHQGNISTSQEECNRCPERMYNPKTRICSIEGCYSSKKIKMTSQECNSCRKTVSEDGQEIEATEANDPTVRFLGKDGYCYPCNIATNVSASKEECEKCNGARSMSGNYCVKENCDKTKNYTNMTQQACHEVCSSEGQVAPFSHFWLNDGKKTSNACYSCSYNSSVKTTYEEASRCVGTRFYSKKTQTSYLCTAGDVELSDISENSEEVSLCLACKNRTVDEETKKCVRMDCSSKTSYKNVTQEVCHACGDTTQDDAYRFFIMTNVKTQRGTCYSCSNTANIAKSNSITSDDFIAEIDQYCKGKRFVGSDKKTSYSCDTNTQVQIFSPGSSNTQLEELCLACGNRSVDETTGKCVKMSCDSSSKEVYKNVSKESCHECLGRFWVETNNKTHLGTCYPCTSDYTQAPNTTLEECSRCGTERYFATPNAQGLGQCFSCSVKTAGKVGDDKTRQDMCKACMGGNYRTISSTNTCQLFDCDTSSYYSNYTKEQCHSVCGQTESSPSYFWEAASGKEVKSNCWPCQYKKEQHVRVTSAEECYRCNTGTQSDNTNHFYSTNGYCYQCFSTKTPKVSGEEHCNEQCPNRFMDASGNCVIFNCSDKTITPKTTETLCHSCEGENARFLNDAKQCVSCDTEKNSISNALTETQRCSGKRFQAGGKSYACSYKQRVEISSKAEEDLCEACPQRVVYQQSNGKKYCSMLDCSTSASYANTTQEDCHSCDGGKGFWLKNKTCYSCLYTSNVANSTLEECSRCDNRYWYNNNCKVCPNTTTEKATEDGLSCVPFSDQFFSHKTNKAYLCSEKTAIETLESECGRCSNRHMNGNKCQLCPNGTTSSDGKTCGASLDGKFLATDNKFYECTNNKNITATQSECSRCDNRYWYNKNCKICPNTTTEKATDDGLSCRTEKGNFFGVKDNKVYSCSEKKAVETLESECGRCSNRHMNGNKCQLCPDGTTSSDGKTCGASLEGKFLATDNKFYECTHNKKITATQSECSRCDNRYWYKDLCQICSTGTAHNNGDSCNVDSGKLFDAANNKVLECSYAKDLTTSATACWNCSKRYMSNGVCKLCPNGSERSDDGKGCKDVPDGKFMGNDNKLYTCSHDAAITTSKEQCDRCSGRFYENGKCQITPKGYYSKNGTKTECGMGYYCPNAGMTQPKACSAGTYSKTTTSSSCTTCEAGYYCPGSSNRYTCDEGAFCPDAGMTKPKNCPSGTYSERGKTQCTDCPKGTYCPYEKMATPLDCGAGYYCPNTKMTTRNECSAGTYSAGPKSTSCTNCQKGYYCPGKTDRKVCGTGYYCPRTNMTKPEICPAGTYANKTTAQTCTDCAEGYYCPKAGASDQTPCGMGYFCKGKKRTTREPCPAGQYSATQNAKACTNCPKGQYQNETGKSSCKTCSGNTITGAAGKTSCTTCTGSKPCANSTHTTCVSKTTKGAICN